jgi:DNA primase
MDAKDEIKQKLDVADVIGEYVTLKPSGQGSFKGVCPFHSERTPSFHVSRERQIWKCFGCDKGGDIFSFVMEMEGMSFVEALKSLARRAGVELPEYKKTADGNKNEVLLQMNELAAKFYEVTLQESMQAVAARNYVTSRGITKEMQEKFRLGASLGEWDALAQFLKKKGYSDELLVDSGLCLRRKSGSGVIDRFKSRLMIPLCDPNGRVLGFTARVLPGAPEDGAKYMNSPETGIYHKGHMLYGLHLAKSAARKTGDIIIVEGNLDVIASHMAGVENVVASSGTALTEDQLRMLSRYVKRLVFCLDDDAAGFAAAKRVFELALKLQEAGNPLNLDLRTLVIPEGAGKDPDEVVKKDPELWRKIAGNSQAVVEYYFEKTLRDFEEKGETSVESRRKIIDELLPEVARLTRKDEKYLYLLRLSDVTHVSREILEEMLTALAAPKPSVMSPKPATPVAAPKPPAQPATPPDKISTAAIFLLGILLKYEKLAPEILTRVPKVSLPEPWNALYSQVEVLYTTEQTQPNATAKNTTLFTRLRSHLEGRGETRLVSAIDTLALRIDEMLRGLSPQAVRAEVDRHLILFKESEERRLRKDLEAKIRHAEIAGDQTLLAELLKQYSSLLAGKK